MKRIFNEELLRAFRNPRFAIVGLLALASFVIGSYRSPLPTLSADLAIHPVNRLILNLDYGEFGFLAALLATLPFADSFLVDRDQGFLRLIVLRAPFRRYLVAKALAVALAGGVSLLVGVLIIFLAGLGGPNDWRGMGNLGQPQGPLSWLYALNPLAYLLYLLASAFGFGAVYGLLGLAVSAFIPNRYVALAAPLVFLQLFSFLEERSLHLTPAFNPLNGLLPYHANLYEGNFTLSAQLAQFAIVLLVSVICFSIQARRQRAVPG